MNGRSIGFCGIFMIVSLVAFAQQKITSQQYIEQYKDIAVIEMKRVGIPASIKLAQGILESASGNSELSRLSNNHFGIKCKSNWSGKKYYYDDDAKGECFRGYKDPADSYRDHSDFLTTNSRYAFLFELDPTDYKGWAHGLKKAGYATNPRYAELVINIIEKNELYNYDLLGLGREIPIVSKDGKPEVMQITKWQGIPAIRAKAGATFESIAEEQNMMRWQVRKYNELGKKDVIEPGEIIYLKPKKRKADAPTHTVKKGESLREISQLHGIKLKRLLKLNRLDDDVEVAPGEVLNLRKKRDNPPATISQEQLARFEKEAEDSIINAQKKALEAQRKAYRDSIDALRPKVPNAEKHTVKAGETLYSISGLYGLTVEELKQLNGIKDNTVSVGQVLSVKKGKVQPQQTAQKDNSRSHTVGPGETLYSISRQYDVTVQQIIELNNLNGSDLKVGQQLTIPAP